MKTIRKISLLVVLSWGILASSAIAEAASTKTPAGSGAFVAFVARAKRFLHVSRAIESDFLFSSMPRITWAQIKAKYRNPDNPKGS